MSELSILFLNFQAIYRRGGDSPANDNCENAEAITGPYPVSDEGTCIEATIDCQAMGGWLGVWYTIEIPNASNTVTIDVCGESAPLYVIMVNLMDDCACDDVIDAFSFEWIPDGCDEPIGSRFTMTFQGIPGGPDEVIYWPAFVGDDFWEGIDFSYTVDVVEYIPPEPPPNDLCEYPQAITGPYPVSGEGTCIGATEDCP